MRDYQQKRKNDYYLPCTLYRRIVALVRDYDRLLEQYSEDALSLSSGPRAVGWSGAVSDPVLWSVIKREQKLRYIEAIEQALVDIPKEYRQDVFLHVRIRKEFPDYANKKTYYKWQAKFIYGIAKRLGEVD